MVSFQENLIMTSKTYPEDLKDTFGEEYLMEMEASTEAKKGIFL